MSLRLITCSEWGARPPREPARRCPASNRVLIHHTAGHHPEVQLPGSESFEESCLYARAIQDYHMDHNGWNDSGHNFIVCRNGLVLQGRWSTVTEIQHGRMVVSAHCPGQNEQIGVEHEHRGTELPTLAQLQASAALVAWCSAHYHRHFALPLYPHHQFFPTACPGNLEADIPWIGRRANVILREGTAL